MAEAYDYWKNASLSDWRSHVLQCFEMSRVLREDPDCMFEGATRVLSDAYLSLQGDRALDRPSPVDERELEDLFWGLQRTSLVIDSIVGSACVVLTRWIAAVKRITVADLALLETKFPFEEDQKPQRNKLERLGTHVMQDFGTRVPGNGISAALAIWQIGNVFKHAGERQLYNGTARVAARFGYSSGLLGISKHDDEEALRQLSLEAVNYTLDPESIERMAIQLGCGPARGLMPLYEEVESWRSAIDKHLSDAAASFRSAC